MTRKHPVESWTNSQCDPFPLPPIPQVIMEAWVKGVNPKGNSTNPSNWDFGSSFFFAGTVVTTIGKGPDEEGLGFPLSPVLVSVPPKQVPRQGWVYLGGDFRKHKWRNGKVKQERKKRQ